MTQLDPVSPASPAEAPGTAVEPKPADTASSGVATTPLTSQLANLISRWAVLGGYVLLVCYFGLRAPDTFLTTDSMRNVLDQSAVPLILAVGLTLVLAVGEFDLSYTATLGLAGAIAVVLMSKHGIGVSEASLIALVAALLVGAVVGVLVTATKASSFIVTLAVGSVITGLEIALTGNKTIYSGVPTGYSRLSRNELFTIRWPVWLAVVVLAGAIVLMHKTKFGRHAYAVGGNVNAAFLAGVPVRRIKMLAYAILGLVAGLGALILTSRSASYYPNASSGYLLNTYAACFLGAAATRRGSFTIAGSTLGVLWIVTLQVGLTLLNEPTWLTSLVQGTVLAVAVLLAARGRRA
jgi:ribose transport system permease protein